MSQTAIQLVKKAVPSRSKVTWFDGLSSSEKSYIRSVVAAMIENPDAAPYLVARNLIRELSINRSVSTVVRTLKEMIYNAKTKTE